MMQTVIFGYGRLGRAIAAAVEERGWPAPGRLGRPGPAGHDPAALAGADLAFECSRGDAVAANVEAALRAGCPALVIATTGWDADRERVDAALRARRAAAVWAPSFSLGVAVFLRLAETAARLVAPLDAFDPFVVEWHRRDKLDRPSGTAAEIVRRLEASGATRRRPVEVSSVRAGATPGMHLVGFDAPGETLELRLTARDRSTYAAGALAAADWLTAAGGREPGLHRFEEVVDDLLRPGAPDRRDAVGAVGAKHGRATNETPDLVAAR